jgi:hypothetical protein
VGWEALEHWGDAAARIEPLVGGAANDVWSVRVNGQLAVGRLGTRSDARMTADRVALIDWDESHVDVPDLDLVLPHNAAGLARGAHDIAAQASAAWEAAVCWDDEYAVRRLAEVRAV